MIDLDKVIDCLDHSYKVDIKRYKNIKTSEKWCKHCGHPVLFKSNDERRICTWCSNYVYKDTRTEFKYKLKKEMIKCKN